MTWENFQLPRRKCTPPKRPPRETLVFKVSVRECQSSWICTQYLILSFTSKVEIISRMLVVSITNVNSLLNGSNEYCTHRANKRKCSNLKQGILPHCQLQPWTSFTQTTNRGFSWLFWCVSIQICSEPVEGKSPVTCHKPEESDHMVILVRWWFKKICSDAVLVKVADTPNLTMIQSRDNFTLDMDYLPLIGWNSWR